MDKIETSSNASDSPSSNLSSLSGLTGFEEELYNIKSLIHLKTQPFYNDHYNEHNATPDCFRKLNLELQKASAINEKYKNDLFNVERKIELANHDKFDKLLKHNLQLEAELSMCKKRISDLTTTTVLKQHKVTEYELEQKISEANQWRNEIDHLELLNNTLKLKYEEAKIDVGMKSTSIAGLKKKIVDLHVEIQTLNLNNMKLSNDLHITHNNFNSIKKSEVWYKEQLHACRSQKSALARELAQIRSTLISKEHELNTRTSECLRLNNLLEETSYCTKPINPTHIESNSELYNDTIKSLTTELVALKRAIESQKDSYDRVTKENTELQTHNTLLMKRSEDKDLLIANLENDRKDLSTKLEVLELKLKDVSELVLKTVTDKSEIEVALVEAKREKSDVECAINLIRSDFSKFVDRFNNTKAEVFTVNSCNRRLKEEKAELERINQKLFKDFDWLIGIESRHVTQQEQILALEKLLEKSQEREKRFKDEVLKKHEEFRTLKKKFGEIQQVKELLQTENQKLREQNTDEELKQKRALQNLKCRLKQIEARCKILYHQILADEEEISALKTNNQFKVEDESECVKNLRALCRAKDLELKEKREQYERNYRTLLRKVKENVRGRNTAEKRCLNLQELHNLAFAELNSCKLQIASMNTEFVNLQSECHHLKDSDAKSKGEVTRLEKDIKQLMVNNASFEETIAQLEDEILTCKNELCEKQSLIERLKIDGNNKDVVNNRLEHETQQALLKITELTTSKNELEGLLEHEVKVQKDLSQSYCLEQQRYAESALQLEETRQLLQQAQIQNDILAEDVKSLSKDSDFRSNELSEVLEQKRLLEVKSKSEENTAFYLQSDMQMLQNELDTLKTDKNFLQRLCNDLKFALTTTKNHSDVLKKHIKALSMEYSSLPNFLDTPSPCQFDEAYITDLLQESVGLPVEQPLSNLQASLNLLKNEMTSLRRQVVENVRSKF